MSAQHVTGPVGNELSAGVGDARGLVSRVAHTLVLAGSTFSDDKVRAYERTIAAESDERARWTLETLLENAHVAGRTCGPLCDDTGIPHLYLELGDSRSISGGEMADILEGVRIGLEQLPGRPMAIRGDDGQRIDQSGGLSEDPADVEAAPLVVRRSDDDACRRLHVLMQGGGPAIRGITHRIFHRHSIDVVVNEIVERVADGVRNLGCSPCTLCIGVGRSQLEAAALMTEAQVFGSHDIQTALERRITDAVNERCNGPMNIGGHTAVLSTFMRVGPQRASGVRIVCIRPCCCFEPRHSYLDF